MKKTDQDPSLMKKPDMTVKKKLVPNPTLEMQPGSGSYLILTNKIQPLPFSFNIKSIQLIYNRF